MTDKEIKQMTDKDVQEINDLLDNWKISNPDWKKMNGLPQALNMWAKRSQTPVNRKSALTSLKLIWKGASNAVEFRGDDRTDKDDIKSGYLNTKGIGWISPFTSRSSSTVDADTETVISSVVSARASMAVVIDNLLNPKFDDKLLMQDDYIIKVVTAWAKTLVLETVPLSSVNPDQHNLGFKTTYDVLSQNATVAKLRQFRRAFAFEKDSKNEKGVIISRNKVKWSGKLEDAPVINYTPVKRKSKGDTEE